MVELWCLCCIMMFRRVNKQPGMQSFEIDAVTIKKSMTEYHHWINVLAAHLFSSLWGKWVHGESGHLSIFTLLKHLMMLLKYNFFSGLHFYTLSKTLIACSSDFLKWKHC